MLITRVHKDIEGNCSIAKQLDEATSGLISLELKRFLWTNNSEIFFADKVLLVEGGEVFLIPAIIDKISGLNQQLDYENISVARGNGKGGFLIYVKMLQCFGIDFLVLGDLDCFKDEVRKLVKHLKIDLNEQVAAIKIALNKMDVSWPDLNDRIKDIHKNYDAQQLKEVFEAFLSGKIERDAESLLSTLSYMQSRFVQGNKEEIILSEVDEEVFNKTLEELRNNKIFIWSKGELENYYTKNTRAIIGSKDTKALQLSYVLNDPDTVIEDYLLHVHEIKLLCQFILHK